MTYPIQYLQHPTFGHETAPTEETKWCSGDSIPLEIDTRMELLGVACSEETAARFGKRWLAKTESPIEGKHLYCFVSVREIAPYPKPIPPPPVVEGVSVTPSGAIPPNSGEIGLDSGASAVLT